MYHTWSIWVMKLSKFYHAFAVLGASVTAAARVGLPPDFLCRPAPPGPGEALKTNLNQMPGAKNGLDGLEVKQYLRNKSTKSKTHFSSFFHVECQSQMLLKIKKDKTCCFILQINDGTHAAFVWFWVFNHFQP